MRNDIAALIPHAGRMCLWDEVLSYDEAGIECRTGSHLLDDHPLRREGRLAALHLIEYGAQAMAIHGGLLGRAAGLPPRQGLLVAVRDARLAIELLEGFAEPLLCSARRMVLNPDGAMYEFSIRCGGRELARARTSVIYV